MKKRLQKKRHLGKFVVYGFTVKCKLKKTQQELTPKEADDICNAFIDGVERIGLGMCGTLEDFYITALCKPNKSLGPDDQKRMVDLLDSLCVAGIITEFEIGPLVDSYYGSF